MLLPSNASPECSVYRACKTVRNIFRKVLWLPTGVHKIERNSNMYSVYLFDKQNFFVRVGVNQNLVAIIFSILGFTFFRFVTPNSFKNLI